MLALGLTQKRRALDGVFTLRTREDSSRLRARLAAGPKRVLVIGGGFTGSEVASVCRELGLPVTLAERGPTPLAGALGQAAGAVSILYRPDKSAFKRIDDSNDLQLSRYVI